MAQVKAKEKEMKEEKEEERQVRQRKGAVAEPIPELEADMPDT